MAESMEDQHGSVPDSPENRPIGRVFLDAIAEGVLGTVLFGFRFLGWTVKWTFATVFFVGVMGLAGYFVFSEAVKGGGHVVVPDVVGMSVTDAANELAGASLELGAQRQVVSEEWPEYHVMLQRPSANKVVRAGRSVMLTISGGRETKPAPNVIGQLEEEALAALTSSRLMNGKIARMPSDKERGIVLGQYPAPGMDIMAGGEIQLLVSDGPATRAMFMPEIDGMPVRAALDHLALLDVKVVPYAVDTPGAEYEIVLAQYPDEGTLLTPGQEVGFDARLLASTRFPNMKRKVDVRYTVPDTSFRPDIEAKLVDSSGQSVTVFPGIGQESRLPPGSTLRFPIAFSDRATVEFYADGVLQRSYYYEGVQPPVVTDVSRPAFAASQPVTTFTNRLEPEVLVEDLGEPVDRNTVAGEQRPDQVEIQVYEPRVERVEADPPERRRPRTSKSWRDP